MTRILSVTTKRNNYLSFFLSVYLSAACLSVVYAPAAHVSTQLSSIARFWYNISSFALVLLLPDAVKLLLVPFLLKILGLLLPVQPYLSLKFDTHFMNSAVFYYGKSYSDFSAYSWIFSTINIFLVTAACLFLGLRIEESPLFIVVKHKFHLNNIYEFSFYVTENILLLKRPTFWY